MATLSGPFALSDDVLLIPVRDLPVESRGQLDCDPGDFALSRLRGRTGSKVIDAQAADLVGRFRQPRTIVEAVILFGREKRVDPDEVLEGAFPLLRSLTEGGFLVPASERDGEAGAASGSGPRWRAGASLLGGTVERTLQVLEDTEVQLLGRGGARSVLKIEHRPRGAGPSGLLRERFRREAAFLTHLAGGPAPALLGEGEVEGRAYLEMEYVAGVDATTAAAEGRERGDAAGRRELLALIRRIAGAYAELHRRGVVHGDVHPRNVLVTPDGAVRLIDFGVASALEPGSGLPLARDRGGIPFFFEPELARAYLGGGPPPPAAAAGEQYAVAAMLYFLAAGAYWRDFSLGREEMLRDIVLKEPGSFRDRGAEPWPELEAVLRRGLAKEAQERYPSMSAFAEALAEVDRERAAAPASAPALTPHLDRLLARFLSHAGLDGPWFAQGLAPAPTCSVNYGAAGLALGLLQIGQRRGDPRLLAAADVWAQRAAREMGGEGAFYNPDIEITREVVGECSPYHSPTGVHAVAALVARVRGDLMGQAEALGLFLEAARRPAAGLDLTLGKSGVLLAAAILLDAMPEGGPLDPTPLRALGEATLAELWRHLDAKPAVARSDVQYLGIAHGWAGFLYATLQWSRVAGAALPAGVERRLVELAELALPVGRGLQWPWVLGRPGEPVAMPGWCNGSCGYVFLWTLAHRLLGGERWLDLARGVAWDAWDSPEAPITLCCGLAGRAYALANLYRATGEAAWLERARSLARRAARDGKVAPDYPHSLWKGEFGLAVLGADLEQPEEVSMPLFEPAGYRG